MSNVRCGSLIVLILLAVSRSTSGGDLTVIPFWDGETAPTPDNPLINRYGGPPVHMGDTKTIVHHTVDTVHSGDGAYRVDVSIPVGDYGL